MPPQNRFAPSFAERVRQSRVARGLEEERSVFEPYRTPYRRDSITSHVLDVLRLAGTVTGRMTSEPGSTANIDSLRWYTHDEVTVTSASFFEWEIPVWREVASLTQNQESQIRRIDVYKRLARPVDFWIPKEGPDKYINHMEASHIVNTLRVIWNHTRCPLIMPISTYNFDRRVFTPWYITQVTMALLTELKKRLATTGEVAGCMEVLDAGWADRGLITNKGLLGGQDVPTKSHTP